MSAVIRTLQPAISVVASTMTDMIAYLPRVPNAGETIVGNSFALGFGGKGANQAVMARRLGAAVRVIGCLGTDVFGDATAENFRQEGIDISGLSRNAQASSGVAPIWVEPDGSNRIVVVPGANLLLIPEEASAAVDEAERVDVVLGQFEMRQEATAAAFRAGKKRGAVTVLNPAPAAPVSETLLEVTDWLVPNEVEFADIGLASLGRNLDAQQSDDVVALARRLGVRLIVTLGERGAALCGTDDTVHYVTPPAVKAVDTTGAGDAFVGTFCFGLARGLDEMTAMRLGCACAAISVTRLGTQTSFPRAEELDAAWTWAQQVHNAQM